VYPFTALDTPENVIKEKENKCFVNFFGMEGYIK